MYVDECLVNGILFHLGGKITQCLHNPPGQVTIQLIVAGAQDQAIALDIWTQLEIRRPHGDAKCLELIGTAYTAPVIVGQDRHRLSFQRGVKHTLAGYKEVIAIHQPDHSLLYELVHQGSHHAKYAQFHPLVEIDWLKRRMGGFKPYARPLPLSREPSSVDARLDLVHTGGELF